MVRISQLSPAQKVALLVSVPATGVLLYFLLKNLMEDEEEDLDRGQVVRSRQTIIEVKVPRDCVGAVIGSGGCVIKQIQEETGARVNFKDEGSQEGQERMVIIRGTLTSAQQAEIMIRKIIADQPPVLTEVIWVPQKLLGRIIGRNGDTIRQTSRAAKARIVIDRSEEMGPGETKKITIRGTPTAIATAKDLIQEQIYEEEMYRRKREVAKANAGELIVVNIWPGDEQQLQVYVSAVEHPGHFWVQLINEKSLQLETLNQEMTAFYESGAASQWRNPQVGDMVAVPFATDPGWYRAKVIAVNGDQVDLYYVDYGDSEILPIEKVMKLRADYLSLPHQAFECNLANVQPVNGEEWDEASIIRFEELTHTAQWRSLLAKTVSYHDRPAQTEGEAAASEVRMPCLELTDPNETKDSSIAEALVRDGHAKWTTSQPLGDAAAAAAAAASHVIA
ncbi:hypothetical protein CAPTEDRAFT_171430 [Capitella teleta]|uniref:Tudor domain-containing protein n=1 Tax=Capitella teleta TaxID=283909 RepID=R7U8R3_CAPTE|nr:hypothetical protein CAPTEDRAFT_171430 [Capitella teleta]|eukprot:ELU02506.1 hypothetical protein CAPTEDRAFT_171430 [Capitella teleta]